MKSATFSKIVKKSVRIVARICDSYVLNSARTAYRTVCTLDVYAGITCVPRVQHVRSNDASVYTSIPSDGNRNITNGRFYVVLLVHITPTTTFRILRTYNLLSGVLISNLNC